MHTIWPGNFNRHHPHWDDPSDTRLFTPEATRAAEVLIETLAENNLVMALPNGLPTHYHNVTKCWSRLDQVFITEHSKNLVISCDTLTEHRGPNTDHLLILTELDLSLPIPREEMLANFQEVDWEAFGKDLEKCLDRLSPVETIIMQRQLDWCCKELMVAIQETIHAQVPVIKLTPKSK